MSKDNKSIRMKLEQIYGSGCFFQRAMIAERLAKIDGVLTYKSFVESRHYTRKKVNTLEKRMTLHHLQHRSEGGSTTVENGANISEMAHRYLHNGLTREQEEIANNMLREFKGGNTKTKAKTKKARQKYKRTQIEFVDELNSPFEIRISELSVTPERGLETTQFNVYEDMTPQEIEVYKDHKKKRNERTFKKFEEYDR